MIERSVFDFLEFFCQELNAIILLLFYNNYLWA